MAVVKLTKKYPKCKFTEKVPRRDGVVAVSAFTFEPQEAHDREEIYEPQFMFAMVTKGFSSYESFVVCKSVVNNFYKTRDRGTEEKDRE